MSKTAVDIVLIPTEPLFAECLALNNQFPNKEHFIDFSAGKHIPHLSLSMTVANDTGIPNQIAEIITQLSAFPTLTLTVKGLESYTNSEGETVHWLRFENYTMLTKLHQKAVGIFPSAATENFGKDAFANNEARLADMEYVRHFQEQHALEHFQPHITLGIGEAQLSTDWTGKTVTFSQVGIYQLGKYCTCAQEIHTFLLEGV
jgi:2'-5' RNA ligase